MTSMDAEAIRRWVNEYFRWWRAKDSTAVAELFTEDARYCASAFREPYRGKAAIRDYWKRATAS